jgi:hypothetical protein
MKSLTFFFVLFISLSTYCQTQTKVTFYYDKSGNRTSHITTASQGLKSTSESVKDSLESFSDQVGDHSILIYPNPFTDEISIDIKGYNENEKGNIVLYDLEGRQVLTLNKVSSRNNLNLSHLLPGNYIIVVIFNNGISKCSVIKN